jgi:hypothetical protein
LCFHYQLNPLIIFECEGQYDDMVIQKGI